MFTASRIPVQGKNSMEFMQVDEFLPPNGGNIIVVPSEIVASRLPSVNMMLPLMEAKFLMRVSVSFDRFMNCPFVGDWSGSCRSTSNQSCR